VPRTRLVLEPGAFDTDDGLIIRVAGEPYPRVVVSVAGIFMSTSGQAAPERILGPEDVAALELFFDYIGNFLVPERPPESGTYRLVADVPPSFEGSNGMRWIAEG
jgi:hypothetical protein